MKKLLCALIALLTLLCGCSAPAGPVQATPEPGQGMEFSDSTLVRREDVDTLLICAVGYDDAGYSMLTIPKDTRVWVEQFDAQGAYSYSKYGPISAVYHAAESAGLAEVRTVETVSALLGGVRIDRYAFLNVVQLRDLAALTDGVYLTAEDAISEFDIPAGYQNIVPNIENYAAYSYLNNIGGVDYPGTDPYKLQRHQQLIEAVMDTLAQQMEERDEAGRDELSRAILSNLRTNLTASDVRLWLESGRLSVAEAAILAGRQDERRSESYWIADSAAILEWVTAHFYLTGEE